MTWALRSGWMVALLLAGTLIGITMSGSSRGDEVDAAENEGARARLAAAQAVDLSTVFRDVSRAIGPSVVSVNRIPRQVSDPERVSQRDFARYMRQRSQTVIGSGVVIDEEAGYIVTNAHVASAARQLAVTLHDERVLRAEVIGVDRRTDLAVLKVQAEKLVEARVADSRVVRVGDWILAAGAPFGLSHTVTAGIVSAVGRADVGITDYEEFIQVDAAINPGNSGGPLVDLKGRVIGINTAIASRSGSSAGIGFAIPSRMMQSVVRRLIDSGEVQRGFLGVNIADLDRERARAIGLVGARGAVIEQVVEGGPADRAGLRVGDIVTAFAGESVADANSLRNRVADVLPGASVPVAIIRKGKRQDVDLRLGRLPETTR